MTTTELLAPQTATTAPEGSRETLQNIQKAFGFVPNLMGTFANSPAVLNGYMALDSFFQKTSFRPAEREIILLATSVENECDYCTAAHSMIAKKMLKVPELTVSAVRAGELSGDDRLLVLAATVRAIAAQKGNLSAAELDRFFAAGFTKEQLLEVLLGVALKTISNYTDHLFHPELDAAFAGEK
jgi:uncharacterized peroxidase-related enzyme